MSDAASPASGRTGLNLGRAAAARFGPSALLGVLFLLIGMTLYVSTGRDDAHYIFWAAANLADHGTLANYNGEYVEQSTTLLYPLLIAALYELGLPSVPLAGSVVSIACGFAAFWACRDFARRIGVGSPWRALLFALLVPYLLYWSFGRLEATLVALLMTLFVMAFAEALRKPERLGPRAAAGAFAGLYVLTRPEAPLVLAAFFGLVVVYVGVKLRLAGGRWDRARPMAKPASWVFALIGLVVLAVTVWRLWYFGEPLPQPAMSKSGESSVVGEAYAGVIYLLGVFWLPSTLIMLGLFGVGLWASESARPRAVRPNLFVLGAFLAAAQAVLVMAVGGDWMEGGRFFVPVLPILFAGAAYGLETLPRRAGRLVLAAFVAAGLTDSYLFLRNQSTGTPIFRVDESKEAVVENFEVPPAGFSLFEWANRANLRDIAFVTKLDAIVGALRPAPGRPVVILSHQLGFVPYYLATWRRGAVYFVDTNGLVTDHVTRCPLTRNFPSDQGGTRVPIGFMLRERAALARTCGIPVPDVVYDIPSYTRLRDLDEQGYTILYEQEGYIYAGWDLGARRLADQFIAVRDDRITPELRRLGESYLWRG